jgi:hypothetical protein
MKDLNQRKSRELRPIRNFPWSRQRLNCAPQRNRAWHRLAPGMLGCRDARKEPRIFGAGIVATLALGN